jgi:hypothetical protein
VVSNHFVGSDATSTTKATVFELYAGVEEITMEFQFRLSGDWDSPISPAQRVPLDMPRQFKTRGVIGAGSGGGIKTDHRK